MAFRDRSEFSPFDHQHGYSHIACYPTITPENSDNPDRFMSIDITDMNSSKRIDLYTPRLKDKAPIRPDIGDLRLIATPLTANMGNYTVEYTYTDAGKV